MKINEELREQIYYILIKMNRKAKISDLHTFKAQIENGCVWVECRGYEVYIKSFVCKNGDEIREEWAGAIATASTRLTLLGLKPETIEV